MDRIFIRGLEVETVVGVFEWEQRIRQKLRIDLEMGVDAATAADGDRLEDTLDYKAVAQRAKAFVEESRFGLVETIAQRLAGMLVEEFGIRWLRVTLNKPGAVRGADSVGVVIERGECG